MPDTELTPVTTSEAATVSTAPSVTDTPAGSDSGPGAIEVAGQVIAVAGEVISDAVKYGLVVAQLGLAAVKLAHLSGQIRATYAYVEGCAASVGRLADQAAGMNVDKDTVGEHREAATVMLSVLAEAEAMAAATEELSVMFQQTADAHESDYGPVAEVIANKEGAMADREFYSNR
ncbi:hypothetical protein GCM10009760_53140 [Kitasatospora kazusensis]|uniref:Excreted virulence factor EspC (Type VII ESX diderm) n=1 Tax=Kitasatospora kazusensis TaxID=407974 RepID=A0ABN3A5D8_9ACTN